MRGPVKLALHLAQSLQRTEALRLMSPLGRLGQPADIANAALYLASDESDFVTGQVLSPNGGLVIT